MKHSNRKTSIKCSCGIRGQVFCPKCSKVKMTILLQNGNDHLKYKRGEQLFNPVWYSFLKHNNMHENDIAPKMLQRLNNHPIRPNVNMVMFYRNHDRSNAFHTVKF